MAMAAIAAAAGAQDATSLESLLCFSFGFFIIFFKNQTNVSLGKSTYVWSKR
jgi:hypothetical protein